MNKNSWEEFGQKYFLIFALVLAGAYGIESAINNKFKNDCIEICLIDKNGPDYRYTQINILPIPSGYSSVGHNARSSSECSCYSQAKLVKVIKEQAQRRQLYKENL